MTLKEMHAIRSPWQMYSSVQKQHKPPQLSSFSHKRRLTLISADFSLHDETGQDMLVHAKDSHEPIWTYVDRPRIASLLCGVTTSSQGNTLHDIVVCIGLEDDAYLSNLLISMYSRCGVLLDACAVFHHMPTPNVISWTTLITCFVKNGHDMGAVGIFKDMINTGMEPNGVTFLAVLSACTNIGSLSEGRLIHVCIVEMGLQSDVAIETSLVNMYNNCNSLEEASIVFNKMHLRNVVAWTSMIAVCAGHGHHQEAVMLFWHMQDEGVEPNELTFMNAIAACARHRDLSSGRLIHTLLVLSGFDVGVEIGTALITMYGKCGEIRDATSVFSDLRPHNIISWTAMMTVYKELEHHEDCLLLYKKMHLEGCKPDRITFTIVLNACSSLVSLVEGMHIHMNIVCFGLETDVLVASALVDMYGKVGALLEAYSLFTTVSQRDAVLWSAMISGCILKGHRRDGLRLFQQMQEEGMEPDEVAYLSVLVACASPEDLNDGRTIHSKFTQTGLPFDLVGPSLITMYANCGEIKDALRVFESLQSPDIVAFNAVITACAQHGVNEKALELFSAVQIGSHKADDITFVNALNACAGLAALQKGRQIQALVVEFGFDSISSVENAVMNFYSKSGALEEVHVMFDKLSSHSMLSWTAFMSAYAQHGLAKEALFLFSRMQEERVMPDEVILLSLLSACSHAGMVDAGADCLMVLSSDRCVGLTTDHFGGLVDLLARAGRLMEAECYLFNFPLEISIAHWSSLVSASFLHNDLGLGRKAVKYMLDMDWYVASSWD